MAWYASHRHHPTGGIGFYQYCYLFKYGFELPPGAREITLPDNARIRVFALSVAHNDHEGVRPARALYDTLERTEQDAPRLIPNGGRFNDSLTVSMQPPLYWSAEAWRYTLDGSEPDAQSPVYHGPIRLSAPTTVRTGMVWPDGRHGAEASARFEVNDTTPPKVIAASSGSTRPQVLVRFSEPVREETAETVGNYRLTPPADILSARLDTDGVSVSLVLTRELPASGEYTLTINGVQDLAPSANRSADAGVKVEMLPAVYTLDDMACDGTSSREEHPFELPVGHAASWTVNLFVRTDRQPANRTLIAGFGSAKDETGRGRYLSKFANGIHFWSANRDVDSTTPLTVSAWQMLTATYDGQTLTLYKDAQKIGEEKVVLGDDDPVVKIAPVDPWDGQRRFAGEIRRFAVWKSVLPEPVLRQLHESHP